MNPLPRILFVGILLAAAGPFLTTCGKGDEDNPASSGKLSTTAPFTIATRPIPDPLAILTDTSAATMPEDNKSLPGSLAPTTLPSGIIIQDIRLGKGEPVTKYCKAWIMYTGWLNDKTIFDDSRAVGYRGFDLGKDQVIKGWEDGLLGMKSGGIRLLTIPPTLGYGDEAHGNIPPNSILHFRVELDRVAPLIH